TTIASSPNSASRLMSARVSAPGSCHSASGSTWSKRAAKAVANAISGGRSAPRPIRCRRTRSRPSIWIVSVPMLPISGAGASDPDHFPVGAGIRPAAVVGEGLLDGLQLVPLSVELLPRLASPQPPRSLLRTHALGLGLVDHEQLRVVGHA